MRNKRNRDLIGVVRGRNCAEPVLQMHLVRDWSGATVYSRENEAYIFMGDSHTGYHFPYVWPTRFLILQGPLAYWQRGPTMSIPRGARSFTIYALVDRSGRFISQQGRITAALASLPRSRTDFTACGPGRTLLANGQARVTNPATA